MSTVYLYTADFLFKGTAICLIYRNQRFLVTAAHVWAKLSGDTFNVATRPGVGLTLLSKATCCVKTLGSPPFGIEGPDLAACRLPEPIASQLLDSTKVYHNVEGADYLVPSDHRWLIGLVGVPATLSSLENSGEDVLALKGIYTDHIAATIVNGAEYLDVSFSHDHYVGLPPTYQGMSGSGLWAAEFIDAAAPLWTGRVSLAGLAFYESLGVSGFDVIRCSGRQAISDLLASF